MATIFLFLNNPHGDSDEPPYTKPNLVKSWDISHTLSKHKNKMILFSQRDVGCKQGNTNL